MNIAARDKHHNATREVEVKEKWRQLTFDLVTLLIVSGVIVSLASAIITSAVKV